MIKRSYIYLSFIILSLLTGCVEKSGYYDDGQQEIIDNLTKNEGFFLYWASGALWPRFA